jgi:hypothetical protein
MNAIDFDQAAKALPFFLQSPLLNRHPRPSPSDRVEKKTITLQEGMSLVLLSPRSHSSIILKPVSS